MGPLVYRKHILESSPVHLKYHVGLGLKDKTNIAIQEGERFDSSCGLIFTRL